MRPTTSLSRQHAAYRSGLLLLGNDRRRIFATKAANSPLALIPLYFLSSFANLFAQVYSRGSSGGRGDNRSRRRRLDRLGSSAGAGSSEPLWMSNFYSVTSSNEASWFALQYFYSDAFHDEINGGSPQRLEQFATDWLDVYLDLNSDLPNKDSCQEFQDLFGNGRGREMRQQCDLLLEKYQGDWTLCKP